MIKRLYFIFFLSKNAFDKAINLPFVGGTNSIETYELYFQVFNEHLN